MKTTFTFWVCFALFFITKTYAQVTTTISYTNAPLNPGNCNVFNTGTLAVIGGLTHYPVCGGITYNGTNAIKLVSVGGATPGGTTATAYGIGYAFKKGHTYAIQVTAAGSAPSGTTPPTLYAGFYAQLPNPAQTLPAVCGPVPNSAWSAVQTGNAFNVLGTNTTVYNFTAYTPTSDLNVMTILAQSFKNGGVDTVKISKITITDRVSLPLTPASVTKTCGTPITQNFVISNPNGAAGITAYNWNLGSASSGWMYNGAQAPQFLTTTSNVLTLTAPACSAPITNITANAVVNGVTFGAGTVTATNLTPTISLSGPSNLCTSATYSVDNIPCNATVAWSVWPQGVVNIAPSGNTVTATKTFDYWTTLTATVSGGCLTAPVTLNKTITAGSTVQATFTAGPDGPYTPTDMPTSPIPNYSSADYITYFGSINSTGLSNISWSTTGDAPYAFYSSNNGFTYTERKSGALVYVVLDAVGFCGPIHKEYPFVSVITGARSMSLNIAPNPARGSLTLTSTAPVNEGTATARTSKPAAGSLSPKVYAVKITDITGRVVKHIENKSGATPLTISLAGIRSGYYLLSAFDGKTWTTKSIVVNE